MPDSRKPIFDTVRNMLRRGFRQSEVEALDSTLDGALGGALAANANRRENLSRDCVPGVPSCRVSRAVSPAGIALIKRFEGCARLRTDGLLEAYPDPASALSRTGSGSGEPWTIGWGATRDGLHGRVGPNTVWTQAQCDERLEKDLERYAADVARAIGDAPTTQAQFDAMVSFHYNTGAIERATLTNKHVAGDFEGAAAEFARWNKAGGRVLKGLVRRRAEETRLYCG